MPGFHPPCEPYGHGHLATGDGDLLYHEQLGNPDGVPVLHVHGGPGSGAARTPTRAWDPARYRVVRYDQRGCGRSTPHAADPAVDLSRNTTAHLVADMELLRAALGVERWLLFGGSWGSTLILAYAQRHPERVAGIVIAAVTTSRRSEIDWLYRGVARFFPEAWERFRDAVPAADRDGDLLAAYGRLMADPVRAVRERAAAAWTAWEDAVISGEVHGSPGAYGARVGDDRLAFVRICAHYFANGAFLAEGALLRDAHRLAGIPGVLIHGRHDLGSPARRLGAGPGLAGRPADGDRGRRAHRLGGHLPGDPGRGRRLRRAAVVTPVIAQVPGPGVPVPSPVAALAGGHPVRAVWRNERGGLTFAVDDPAGRRFVKWAPAGSGLDLRPEADRLRWAAPLTPVPRVLGAGSDPAGRWLVTAGLPGTSAVDDQWSADPRTAAAAIGAGLRALHDRLPVEGCPFSWSVRDRLARVTAGDRRTDPARWHPEHAGLTPAQAAARLADPPPVDRLVVCHGDPCAPNTLIGPDGRWSGHVDLGALGVADRWADLAVATWSLDWNYGPGWQPVLLDAYGIAADERRTAWYRLLWDLGD